MSAPEPSFQAKAVLPMRVNNSDWSERLNYLGAIVPDAGTGMLNVQQFGHPGEVYNCPRHTGKNCSMCGGSGYRNVCDKTDCHENGCNGEGCTSSKADFDRQQSSKRKGGDQNEHI